MTLTLYVLLLAFEVILFSKVDKIFFKTYYTPFVVLAVPFLIVTGLVYSIGPLFGFFSLSYRVVMIWIIYLFLFWLFGSFLTMSLFRKYFVKNEPFKPIRYRTTLQNNLINISWLIIIIVFIRLIKTCHRFHGFKVGDEQFALFFVKGIIGHLIVFLILMLIYFSILLRRSDKSNKILILLILLTLFIYQVKTWIFAPVFVILFFLLIEKRIIIRVKSLVFLIFLIYFVFLIFYFPLSGFNKEYFFDLDTYKFIINHILFYLFSGVLGFSEHIKAGFLANIDPELIFRPFINIFNVITFSGEIKPIVSQIYYPVNYNSINASNVYTFFGTLIAYSGYLTAAIYTIILSISLYFLLLLNFINKNIWIILLYLFMLSGLGMGWFNFYFNNLTFIEIPVYCLILALLSENTSKWKVN